jgi:lipopolysaccharide export system protein LptC
MRIWKGNSLVLTLKNMTISLLIILAMGLSAWSIMITNPLKKVSIDENPNQPDSFMEDVVATIFNKEGNPSLKLVAPQMTHYPENNMTHIVTPHVTIYRKSPQPWYIESEYANAKNGIDEILFWSNVNIHHPADIDNPTTSLKTNSLTIFPDQKIASTKEAVTFVQPDTTVHAVGMLANFDDGTIKLLSQAKGEYAPKS